MLQAISINAHSHYGGEGVRVRAVVRWDLEKMGISRKWLHMLSPKANEQIISNKKRGSIATRERVYIVEFVSPLSIVVVVISRRKGDVEEVKSFDVRRQDRLKSLVSRVIANKFSDWSKIIRFARHRERDR